MKKLAVLGGTFDPVHLAHIESAKYIQDNCDFDKLILLPAGVPHFKKDSVSASPHHRLNMLKLACKGLSFLEVDDFEILNLNPSYTVNTIPYLVEKYSAKVTFIIGADVALSLHKWYKVNELCKLCDFLLISRPNVSLASATNSLKSNFKHATIQFCTLEVPAYDISSSKIKQQIQLGNLENVSSYLNAAVISYIKEHKLYA